MTSRHTIVEMLSKPGFWLLALLIAGITVLHYGNFFGLPPVLINYMAGIGLDRHAFERIFYLVPIIWSGFIFGWKGSATVSVVALVCMLPRAFIISQYPLDALFETSAVFIVGSLVAFTFQSLRIEREQRIQLAALDRIARGVSQSLDIGQILKSSIDNVVSIMRVNAAFIFLIDEDTKELYLAAHSGLSEAFVYSIGRLEVGKGLNGWVAKTGKPAFVRDASTDPRVTRMAVKEENIHSQYIIPLIAKGKVTGTLCVAMHSLRIFKKEEVETLTAIGNQIGVAIENSRLYEKERVYSEQLKISGERYRQLFENAHDAIWIHDLEENIIAANDSLLRLSEYSAEEIKYIKAEDLIAEDSKQMVKTINRQLLTGEKMGVLSEITMVKKSGARASIQLSTSVIFSNGTPTAIQHIARDITHEQRMRENLRYYLSEVTKAQEDERKRIARELHDDTIQDLVVLAREIDEITDVKHKLTDEDKDRLEELRQQVNTVISNVRSISQDLRPPTLDRLGLVPALEWLGSNINARSGINVGVKVFGEERKLSNDVELLLFRVVQEALSNVWRHSGANDAKVLVEFTKRRMQITIVDNGQGFEPPEVTDDLVKRGRLGLAGMQERMKLLGGSIKIESKPGNGTTVVVKAPL